MLQVTAGAAPALAWEKRTTDVACSAGLVAVKFGTGIICVAGAGEYNVSVNTRLPARLDLVELEADVCC